MIRVKCRKCQSKFNIHEAFRGGYCRCPHCERFLLVPSNIGQPKSLPLDSLLAGLAPQQPQETVSVPI